MELTQQIHSNECGVCAINTLFKHYYKRDIKSKLLEEANITGNGLNIYDFELLCHKHGILTEVYSISENELKDLEINDVFVTMVSNDLGNHYVIVKKKNKCFEIWDSAQGHNTLNEAEFFKRFNGIIIIVSKDKTNFKVENNKIVFSKHVDLKFICLLLFLQILIIGLSMIGANFLSITISNSFSNNSYANTIIISLLFLIFYSLNSFVKYLCNLLSAKKIKTNYLKMTDIFIKSIKNKNETFLHKVNKNYLYIIDHCINSITTYNTVELTNFLSSFIFGFALIVYIGIIAPIFISICVCITILFSILGYIECKYKQKLLSRVVNNGSNNSSICSQYISCLSKNQMGHMTNNLLEKFKGNYSEYINLFGQTSKFNGGVNLINEISEKILLIIAVIMSSFFLQTYFHSDIAKIILLVTLIGMFFNNVNTIINFISLHVEYKMLLEIFNNIIGIGNKNVGEYDFSKTKSITYKKQKIFNGWHIKENDGNFKDVLTKYKNSDLITINNINISDVKTEWINNNVYTFDSYQEINPSLLLKGISENKCLIDFIKENGVDIMKMNEKIEHYQLLNVLYCTTLKNKIIVFNKNLSYIDKKYMDSIKKKIIPYIKKNNYLIFIDKTT